MFARVETRRPGRHHRHFCAGGSPKHRNARPYRTRSRPLHVRTLAQSELRRSCCTSLRITGTHVEEHPAAFDQWMHNAGREPSDPEYVETRRLMEETIPDDLAAFHPRYSATSAAGSGEVPGIEMVNAVVFSPPRKSHDVCSSSG